MTSSALPRRAYPTPPGHHSPPSPTLETTSSTPAQELSSWLPDDLCAACGAQAQPSHLYCSDECRRKDQHHSTEEEPKASATQSPTTQLAITSTSAPPTARLGASTRHYFTTTTAADIDSLQRFRYPLPPSPLLFAQRTTLAQKPHQPRKTSTPSSNGDSSSERHHLGRRISTDSSESSQASSSAFLTDPSTPSPGWSNRGCDSNLESGGSSVDDDDELNNSEFRLPPSVALAGTVLLNNSTRTLSHRHLRSRSDRQQVSPVQSQIRRPRSSVGGNVEPSTAIDDSPTMSFARRPGSTNVPTSVLYSPVLVAKMTDSDAQATTNITSQSSKARSFLLHDIEVGPPLSHVTGGSSVSAAHGTVKRRGGSSPGTRMGLRMLRVRSDPSQTQLPTDEQTSPQQHDSGGSGSSSAARTARATSPSSLASSGELCGRPGCSGASLFRGAPFSLTRKDSEPARQNEGSSDTKTNSVHSPVTYGEALSPRSMPRHKHTHSAKAGLTIYQHFNRSALRVLAMTPAQPHQLPSDISAGGHDDQQKGLSKEEDASKEHSPPHPRGRSHARGRRSTSRRSRSPPRAAARGRSVVLQSEERQRKAVHPTSPPLEAVRPRSDPIDIDLPSRKSMSDDSLSSSALSNDGIGITSSTRHVVDDEDDGDDDDPRRGRSPAQRSRGPSIGAHRSSPATKASHVLTDVVHCKRAFVGREEHPVLSNKGSIESHATSHLRFNVDPGFDDVENLELEA